MGVLIPQHLGLAALAVAAAAPVSVATAGSCKVMDVGTKVVGKRVCLREISISIVMGPRMYII